MFAIGWLAGCLSGYDQRVGKSAIGGVLGGADDVGLGKRRCMFHVDVCKDGDASTECFSVAKGLVGTAFDDSLVGGVDASVNIDADEGCAGSGCDCRLQFRQVSHEGFKANRCLAEGLA